MSLIPAARISGSGMQAERTRMEVAAHNLANANTSRSANGKVFQRSQVVLRAFTDSDAASFQDALKGVQIAGIVEDQRPPKETYAPHHPDADENGMVLSPNVSPMEELLDMITASRSYEANLSVMKQSRSIADRTIDLLRHQG
tara:strand:- start:24 stop:452 length:429 start_codon:yes stop_codon:yes gene_type:complete